MAVFKTRARALDMLGRQQIAGRPTAINELFKNAHDAYADHVEVDYYRADGLFVLRDDGLGMTQEDFERRWLTLGTESKVKNNFGLGLPPSDASKPMRPILGEKGIGRLAVASIGPQLLIMTRAKRDEGLHDLVAAYLHWGIFECPGIDLDQIEIPIRTFRAGVLPNRQAIIEMLDLFLKNLVSLKPMIEPSHFDKIVQDVTMFTIDPTEIDGYLGFPSLSGNGHGTQFIILPADPALQTDIEDKGDEWAIAPPLLKMLVGFTNTMTPGHEPPRIKARFRYHQNDEIFEDLIEDQAFFTPEEFGMADHHIQGTFDEFGQFSGTVGVYREAPVEHVVPWNEARGKRTECGPFAINFAYLQGNSRDSRLQIEDWGRLSRKLNKIGGLYIYKDGVRVLPYGNSDNDFLEIERNRTKSAYYYFFSYRRMFGVIEISQTSNSNLTEKAGREGFRENKAYSQFKDILKSFFVQIAGDFFREGGAKADTFITIKAERDRLDKARKRREKLVSVKRNAFRALLDKFFERLDTGMPQSESEKLLDLVRHELEIAMKLADSDQASQAFIDTETRGRRLLEELRGSYRISKPRGMGLGKQLTRDWAAYQSEYQRIDASVFTSIAQRIDELVGELAKQARLSIDLRRRVEAAIKGQITSARTQTNADRRETREVLDELKDRVLDLTRESLVEVDNTIRRVESDLSRLEIDGFDDAYIVQQRDSLEGQIISIVEQKHQLLENVREQLRSLDFIPDEQGNLTGITETTEAIEDELISLRERAEVDIELSQIGLAIGIINHEFEATIASIRNSLRRLKAWADVNADLGELYGNIRTSFDHLDGYLTLFTPLHRRLYRTPVEIAGADIVTFLTDLFGERLRRHEIKLEATARFRKTKTMGYPSTFYPVFINLVDNAVYWLKGKMGPKFVRLDADNGSFIVLDNGPGIPDWDAEAVFELRFTRKVGGSGMGLHISREALRGSGYQLVLVSGREPGQGAMFRIEPEALSQLSTEEETE